MTEHKTKAHFPRKRWQLLPHHSKVFETVQDSTDFLNNFEAGPVMEVLCSMQRVVLNSLMLTKKIELIDFIFFFFFFKKCKSFEDIWSGKFDRW